MSGRPKALVPVTKATSLVSSKAVDDALALVEATLGGREAFLQVFTLAEPSPAMRRIQGLLADPDFDQLPLGEICRRADLTPGDLLTAYRRIQLTLAQVKATKILADGLPEVARDVVRRAAPHDLPCPVCRGAGVVDPPESAKDAKDAKVEGKAKRPHRVVCPECLGTKVIRVLPDLDRQKLAVEMGQLLPKGAGIAINQSFDNRRATVQVPAVGLERLQQSIGALLYGNPGEVIDADPSASAAEAPETEDPDGTGDQRE